MKAYIRRKSAAAALAAIVVVAIALTSNASRAEQSVSSLLQDYDAGTDEGRLFLEFALKQTEDGIGWANAMLRIEDQEPLYCPPEEMVLSGSQIVDMLRQESEASLLFAAQPFGLGILSALRNQFPCE